MRTVNVLLVDDDESAALLFRLIAEREANIRLEVADGGEKAIEYLAGRGPFSDRVRHPFPDLVVLDLLMPRISGFDVLDWCRTQPGLDSVPKVIFSGSVRENDEEEALARGAVRFVRKPTDLSSFKATIHEILECAAPSRHERPRPAL